MVESVSACTTRDIIGAILDRDGCLIIENAVDASIVNRVAHELDGHFERANFGQGYFVGLKTKRLGSILRKSGTSLQMMMAEPILEAMQHMLLPHCERFQLNLTQAISIHPGQDAQILHRDDELFPGARLGGEYMANAIWALDDFTKENGGTQLVVGSHLWPRDKQPEQWDIDYATMPKGSVLIYRGSLLHGGGANRTQKPRSGLIFSYNLGWLRQGENQYLAYPPALARYLPAEAQQLIGYSVHRPNLGQFECSDPQLLLSEKGHGVEYNSYDFLTPEQDLMLRASLA